MTCRAVNICGASAYLYTRADCRGKKKDVWLLLLVVSHLV